MLEMYRITKKPIKIRIPCQYCKSNGSVSKKCHSCNGRGTHNKTFQYWIIAKHTCDVTYIDREHHTGPLRFWTCQSEFYPEERKLLHFNKKDAQYECDVRNKEVDEMIIEMKKRVEKATSKETMDCYIPASNTTPLCVGKQEEKCKTCAIYEAYKLYNNCTQNIA